MCGIFGWVASSSRRLGLETLSQLTDLLRHRGPDGGGYWLSNTRDGHYQIALGHRRLSIIDIEGGTQPMRSADGSCIVVFNGEIYNYLELRRELIEQGHTFETQSDTEVLLKSYRAWGREAVTRFRGMFAFALWDDEKQELLIARDAYGKKPLFISERPDGLMFGSEIGALLESPGANRVIDPTAIGSYLLNRYVPGPDTFFRDIKKLPPGSYAVWCRAQLEIVRFYTPPFATTDPDFDNIDEAAASFGEVFEESVRIRLRSDAPFGAYLSGGLDSSAVVAMMARHISSPIKTFSVGFREEEYSELSFAETVAKQFGTDHEELIVEPDAFLRDWSTAILHRGAPVSEASDVPILMLSKLAALSVKMVLTGEGADELLGGYPKHRAEQWIHFYHRLMPGAWHATIVEPAARALPYGFRRLKILSMAVGERDPVRRMQIWFGGLNTHDRNRLLARGAPPMAFDVFPFSATVRSALRRTLFFDQTSWLPDNLLERGDRMMMAGSIEGRMPFMDTELAALVARFPDKFLVGNLGGKTVLRKAMRNILPAEIIKRKKVGFRVPFDIWLRGPYKELVRDLLISPESAVSALCNRTILVSLIEEHVTGRKNNDRLLWSLMNLEMFLRMFKPINPNEAHSLVPLELKDNVLLGRAQA